MTFRELLRKINDAVRPMHVAGRGDYMSGKTDAMTGNVRQPMTGQDERPK